MAKESKSYDLLKSQKHGSVVITGQNKLFPGESVVQQQHYKRVTLFVFKSA